MDSIELQYAVLCELPMFWTCHPESFEPHPYRLVIEVRSTNNVFPIFSELVVHHL